MKGKAVCSLCLEDDGLLAFMEGKQAGCVGGLKITRQAGSGSRWSSGGGVVRIVTSSDGGLGSRAGITGKYMGSGGISYVFSFGSCGWGGCYPNLGILGLQG